MQCVIVVFHDYMYNLRPILLNMHEMLIPIC